MEGPIILNRSFEELLGTHVHLLEENILPDYLKKMRWFGGKAKPISAIKVYRQFSLPDLPFHVWVLLKVRYHGLATEIYSLPLAFIRELDFDTTPSDAILAKIEHTGASGFLVDALHSAQFRSALFDFMHHKKQVQLEQNCSFGDHSQYLTEHLGGTPMLSRVSKAEQSNSSVIFGEKFFFKLFRKVEYAINPDWEIIRHLSLYTKFRNIPVYAGSIALTHAEKPNMLLGLMQAMVPNQGDAWSYFIAWVRKFFQQVIDSGKMHTTLPAKPKALRLEPANLPKELLGFFNNEFFIQTSLLGQRTAELHLALGLPCDDAAFSPESIRPAYIEQLRAQVFRLIDEKTELLIKNMDKLPKFWRDESMDFAQRKEDIRAYFERVMAHDFNGLCTRIHGDYHLGQVLRTGHDFVILDFEGEPDKAHELRCAKHPPLKDVAGMMRSFRYAAYAVLFNEYGNDAKQREVLMHWADQWYHYTSRFFLWGYLRTIQDSPLQMSEAQTVWLLQLFSFEKAIYELGYEINNRPDWTVIPLSSLTKFAKHYLHEH